MEVSDADAQNEKLFVGFDGRDADLRSVTRYSMYDIMMYRTNLYTHSHRTAALVRAINSHAPSLFKGYDTKKAELIALVHDDAEIIFGDIQAGNKSKMTPEQLREVHEQEARAIKKIAKRFPKRVGGYVYETLLEEAVDYSSLEAQVVCYADKYDALGEAYHEALAGNHYFVTNVVNEYGKIPTPFEYYRDFFGGFLSRFPSLAPLFADPPTILLPVHTDGYRSLVLDRVPHSPESLKKPTGHHHYDVWKGIVMADTNTEVVDDLLRVKEKLPNS